MKKANTKLSALVLVGLIGVFSLISCEKEDGSGTGGGGGGGDGSFSYTDIGPNLGSDWHLMDARRSDAGLWGLYENLNTDAQKLARYDFQSKQWNFWDFDKPILDFDTWLVGEDQGNGAVVIEKESAWASKVRFLSSTVEWDTEDIGQQEEQIAMSWGEGQAFSNWIGASNGSDVHSVFHQTSTCCPLEWDKIDIPSSSTIIYDMWASSRKDGYVLVTTATQSFIFYSEKGMEITFSGGSYAFEKIAWDTETGIPYTLIDGILYRIEANPNAQSATAVTVADLTELNHGVTMGIFGLDIRLGKAYVSYGAVVDLSNGSVKDSWLGETKPTNVDDMIIATLISTSSYVFTPPSDQNGVFVYVRGTDPNTFEHFETWVRVRNAL